VVFAVALGVDGALRWSHRVDGYWIWSGTLGLVGDEGSNLYFRAGDDTVSLGPGGAERFSLKNLSFPGAAAGGRVWGVTFSTGDGKMHHLFDAYDASSGTWLYELGPREIRAMPLVPPVFVGGVGYGFDAGMDYDLGESLVSFDPVDGTVLWSVPLAGGPHGAAAAELLATDRDSLLLAQGEVAQCDDTRCDYVAAHLREVSTQGKALWSCELPVDTVAAGLPGAAVSLTLAGEVLAVGGSDAVIRGYRVQGARPAAHGWLSARGNMQRIGRPVP
jgi:hypothetical protein